MGASQVDPQALDQVAYLVKSTTIDVDGARLDLGMRTWGLGQAIGAGASHGAALDLLRMADTFLVTARDELAAMSEFANQVAAAVRQVDGASGSP